MNDNTSSWEGFENPGFEPDNSPNTLSFPEKIQETSDGNPSASKYSSKFCMHSIKVVRFKSLK